RGTFVDAPDIEARAHEEDEVAPGAAPGVEHLHATGDPAAEQLIEQVDVDIAELFAQARRWLHHARAKIWERSASHSASPVLSVASSMARSTRPGSRDAQLATARPCATLQRSPNRRTPVMESV